MLKTIFSLTLLTFSCVNFAAEADLVLRLNKVIEQMRELKKLGAAHACEPDRKNIETMLQAMVNKSQNQQPINTQDLQEKLPEIEERIQARTTLLSLAAQEGLTDLLLVFSSQLPTTTSDSEESD